MALMNQHTRDGVICFHILVRPALVLRSKAPIHKTLFPGEPFAFAQVDGIFWGWAR